MPATRQPLGPTILNYIFAHKDDATETRCAHRVATAVTDTHRRYINAMKEIEKLVRAGKLTRGHQDNWAEVLNLPTA